MPHAAPIRAPTERDIPCRFPIALCGLALLVEAAFGYPSSLFTRIGHPVTWIGALIAIADRGLNRDNAPARLRRRTGAIAAVGMFGLVVLVGVLIQAAVMAACPTPVALVVLGILASSCLAQRSLHTHVRAVAEALERDGLAAARDAVAMIVGRETKALDQAAVARAAIESLAENFADGIVAPTLWLAAGGLAGGLVYKAINTADSMIGHRTARHEAFGYAAAKIDDAANWPAARLAALWLVLAARLVPDARPGEAWRIMRRDARGHASPNAGWPEAAMAGALGVRLGGPRVYAGTPVADTTMGDGDGALDATTIRRALRLYRFACGLNMAVVVAAAVLIARWR